MSAVRLEVPSGIRQQIFTLLLAGVLFTITMPADVTAGGHKNGSSSSSRSSSPSPSLTHPSDNPYPEADVITYCFQESGGQNASLVPSMSLPVLGKNLELLYSDESDQFEQNDDGQEQPERHSPQIPLSRLHPTGSIVYCASCNTNMRCQLSSNPQISRCPACETARYIYHSGSRRVFTIQLNKHEQELDQQTLDALYTITMAARISEHTGRLEPVTVTTGEEGCILSYEYRQNIPLVEPVRSRGHQRETVQPTIYCQAENCGAHEKICHMPSCRHAYCASCVEAAVNTTMSSGMTAMTCLDSHCRTQLTGEDILRYTENGGLYMRYCAYCRHEDGSRPFSQTPQHGGADSTSLSEEPISASATSMPVYSESGPQADVQQEMVTCQSCWTEFVMEESNGELYCPNCSTFICIKCKTSWYNAGNESGHICR